MLCPACKVDMLVLEFELVEIDYCRKCGGVWLDSGELSLLGERAGAIGDDLLTALENESGKRRTNRRCPVCRKAMSEVSTPPHAIVLDKCPRRHGLWFDRGELPGVIAAARQAKGGQACGEKDSVLARFLTNLEAQRKKQEVS